MENANITFDLKWSVNIPSDTAKAFFEAMVKSEKQKNITLEKIAKDRKTCPKNKSVYCDFISGSGCTLDSSTINSTIKDIIMHLGSGKPEVVKKEESNDFTNKNLFDACVEIYNRYKDATKEETQKKEELEKPNTSTACESEQKEQPCKEYIPRTNAFKKEIVVEIREDKKEEETKSKPSCPSESSCPKKSCPPPEGSLNQLLSNQEDFVKMLGPMFSMLSSAMCPKEGIQTPTTKVMDDFSVSSATETILKKVEKEEKETCVPCNRTYDSQEIADILGKGGYID
jgi:hypothetical protein